jgi:hypothetical protein
MYQQYTFGLVRLARLAILSLEPPCAFVVEKKPRLTGTALCVCGLGKRQFLTTKNTNHTKIGENGKKTVIPAKALEPELNRAIILIKIKPKFSTAPCMDSGDTAAGVSTAPVGRNDGSGALEPPCALAAGWASKSGPG